MDTSPELTEEQQESVHACFAKLLSVTPIIGPGVSLKEQGTEWTRWFLYADSAMTSSIGAITLKLKNLS